MRKVLKRGSLQKQLNLYNDVFKVPHNKHTVKDYRVKGALHTVCLWLQHDFNQLPKILERGTSMAFKGYNQIDFVNVNLSTKQLDEFDNTAGDLWHDVDTLLTRAVESDAKISINFNTERQAFYVSLITLDNHKLSPNRGFSSFSGDLAEALLLTLYKYLYVLETDLSKVANNVDNRRG